METFTSFEIFGLVMIALQFLFWGTLFVAGVYFFLKIFGKYLLWLLEFLFFGGIVVAAVIMS